MNDEDIIRDAQGVQHDGQEPRHSAEAYESALLGVARLEQRPSESLAQALARVAADGNADVEALTFAAERVRARQHAVGKRMTKAEAESEMLAIAKREARPGESVAMAFGRLCESDERMAMLYGAAQAAEVAEDRATLEKAAPQDKTWALIEESARHRRREGETLEKAVARLLEEDPVVRDAYAAAQGL